MKSPSVPPWKYLLSDIDYDEREQRAVLEVLAGKWLSMGPKTAEFERVFSDYAGVPLALATANGTAALHLALLSLGIGRGDEVVVPSLTFVATVNAILYAGARPVFADISSLPCPLSDPADIERKITGRTKAIVVMHYAGYPCEMHSILAVARKHGLCVIEDAAHALGSWCGEQMCGTFGDVGCYSFFANKNLAVGEGGMLVTSRRDLYEKAKLLRSHGMTSRTWDRVQQKAFSYDVVDLGFNYRMTEVAAALGIVQLAKLPANNRRRDELFNAYVAGLSRCNGLIVPFADLEDHHRYSRHLLPILLDAHLDRALFMAHMQRAGIQTSIHYPPVHTTSYYRRIARKNQVQGLGMTEEFGRRVVTLPLHPLLSPEDVANICASVCDFVGGEAKPRAALANDRVGR